MEQGGGENDRDLVEMVLPGSEKPSEPILFYDTGAFVWFAHIIEWEFPGFSVEKCFPQLLKMREMIEEKGKIEGTIHRFLLVARK